MIPDYEAIARSTQEGAERVMAWLKVHGKEVGRLHAEEQDKTAGFIVNIYYFLQRSVDAPSVGLMMGAIHDYCKAHGVEGLE